MTVERLTIRPARTLRGVLGVPGDKSISHRYVMLGSLSRGVTTIDHLAPGADVAATIACFQALGADISRSGHEQIRIHGRGVDALHSAPSALDAANSGTTMRLMAGILAGQPFRSTLVGDASLSRRPMRRVIDPLAAMGARIESADGRPPLTIDGGRLRAIDWRSPVASAQVKSAVLFAGLRAEGTTTVHEPAATRDHSERAFPAFGLRVKTGERVASIDGGQQPIAPAGTLRVGGDPSSAAVWACAAAALTGSRVTLTGVCLNPHRLGFVRALERMGADVVTRHTDDVAGEPIGTIEVSHHTHLPTTIDAEEVPALIDELPVLAARAALGGGLDVHGAGELRHKESDRISALVRGLQALGVDATEHPDGFSIDGRRRPAGGAADAASDHRLVMAFALVGLGAAGPSTITGAQVVGISYPTFVNDLWTLAQT